MGTPGDWGGSIPSGDGNTGAGEGNPGAGGGGTKGCCCPPAPRQDSRTPGVPYSPPPNPTATFGAGAGDAPRGAGTSGPGSIAAPLPAPAAPRGGEKKGEKSREKAVPSQAPPPITPPLAATTPLPPGIPLPSPQPPEKPTSPRTPPARGWECGSNCAWQGSSSESKTVVWLVSHPGPAALLFSFACLNPFPPRSPVGARSPLPFMGQGHPQGTPSSPSIPPGTPVRPPPAPCPQKGGASPALLGPGRARGRGHACQGPQVTSRLALEHGKRPPVPLNEAVYGILAILRLLPHQLLQPLPCLPYGSEATNVARAVSRGHSRVLGASPARPKHPPSNNPPCFHR